jgi:sugar phosphate isomerase/epimerase
MSAIKAVPRSWLTSQASGRSSRFQDPCSTTRIGNGPVPRHVDGIGTSSHAFVDSFSSPAVRIHFDTGNIMLFQHPEHWIPILGKRIANTHFKEFTKKGTDHSLESFRPLLDGTSNWPVVMDALEATDYHGYCTFEYFHPYAHYPEALIY